MMSNRQLPISLSLPDVPIDEYYLVMEQVAPNSTEVEVEDAASFIDELYKTSICDDSFELPICGGSITINDRPETPTREEIQEAIEKLGIPDCEDQDGSYDVQVEIYKSHQQESYKLVVEGGEEIQSVIVEETKEYSITIENQKQIRLPYPTTGEVTAYWQGSVFNNGLTITPPTITSEENILSWGVDATGIIVVSHDTTYDLIDVHVLPPDEDETTNTADLLAFYHNEVYLLIVEDIPEDENLTAAEISQLCDDWGGTIVKPPPDPEDEDDDCYTTSITTRKCDCSGRIFDSIEIRSPTSCPEDQEGGQVGDIKEAISFINCQESDRVNNPEYYEEVCCTPPPFGLPDCKTKLSIFTAGTGLSAKLMAYYQAFYEGKVNFIGVAPDQGFCGIYKLVQDVDALNCCDDVPKIEIDVAGTDFEIGLPGSATLKATGGEAPYYWKTSGGYVFSNGLNEDITTGPENTIYTVDDEVCGDATTNLHDDCSSVSFNTTQTAGDLEPKFPENLVMSPDSSMEVTLEQSSVGDYTWTGGNGVSWEYEVTAGPKNILNSSVDFCGTSGNIGVTDVCGNSDSAVVRSTDGVWVAYPFDDCSCPASSGDVTYTYTSDNCWPLTATVINGEHKCYYIMWSEGVFVPGVCTVPPTKPCPGAGPFPPLPTTHCDDYSAGLPCGSFVGTNFSGDCCVYPDGAGPGVDSYALMGSEVAGYWKWECP